MYPDNEVLFSSWKKWDIKPWKKQGGTLNAYCQVSESNLQRLHSCDSSYTALWKIKTIEREDQRLPGVWGELKLGEWISKEQKIFRAVKYHVYYNGEHMSFIIHVSKPIQRITLRMNRKSWLSGSVSRSMVPCTKMFQAKCPVRAHTWVHPSFGVCVKANDPCFFLTSMFLSLSLSQN